MVRGNAFLQVPLNSKIKTGALLVMFACFFSVNELKSQTCDLCKIPSFPSLTVYQAFQTGHGMGFGMEAGNWKKDGGHFSYFFGTNIVWTNSGNPGAKSNATVNQTLLSFYVKGQYKLANHLYAVAAPGIVNLTYMEFQAGLRYVIPITHVIGIGVEPTYAFGQKQVVVNANVHFALR